MTDAVLSRRTGLVWGTVALLVLTVLGVLVFSHYDTLDRFDARVGADPFLYATEHQTFQSVLLFVQKAFEVIPMTVFTIITAGLLAWRGHRRAAVWVLIVMVTTTVAADLLKLLIGRKRPVFDDPITTLSSLSFPSGHASGISAAAGVTIVLTVMLVRRSGVRRLLVVLALAIALVVGADRIFLGVHNLSDVIGGYSLGSAVTLFALAFFDPRPTSIARLNEALPEVYRGDVRRVAVVVNPVKVGDATAFEAMVRQLAVESGYTDVTFTETTLEDIGHGQAHAAAVSGVDLVVTCGGDGTVRAVAEELAGTGIPLGIVPAGTGNLLARNLDLPLYLRAAVDVALNGQDRAVDLVEVTGDAMEDATFLVMAGMGLDAAVMAGVNEEIKARVGWLAYVLSGLKAMMYPAVRVEVSVDGAPFTKHRARTIVVGNVGFLQGGLPLIPDAEIDDGKLDVVLLHPRRFLSWVPLAVRVLTRARRTDELVDRMRGETVTVRAATDTPRQLDGDLIEPGRELHCRCVHGRLLVRVPR